MRRLSLALLLASLAGASAHGQTLIRSIDYPSPSADARFGAAVAAVPDLNGDAVGDLVVGAPGATSTIIARLGRAYTFSGATGVALDTLVSPAPETDGAYGHAVAGLPDRNGDGRGEVLVGAVRESVTTSEDAGRAYVVAGITETVLSAHVSPNTLAFGRYGATVRTVPDVSGDGRPDYAVAATSEANGRGRVYLYSGADGSLLRTINNPGTDGWNLGGTIAGVPDVDGDGRGELLLLAGANAGLGFGNGRAYLVSGATGTLLLTLAPDAGQSFSSLSRLASLPDVDGDGLPDLVLAVGSSLQVYSSATGMPLRVILIAGGAAATGVEGIPDLNGDGAGDLLVGLGRAVQGPDFGVGEVRVYSGASGAVLLTLTSPNPRPLGLFGDAVAVLPDLTGDGRPDLLIGAPGESVAGFAGAGRVYLYSTSGIVAAEDAPGGAEPSLAALPNPARESVTLSFTLPHAGAARLTLHDVLGRTVAEAEASPHTVGSHTVTLDTRRLAPGVYLARLTTTGGSRTARLTVAR